MGRCTALYSNSAQERILRTTVELSGDVLYLTFPDGRWHNLPLHGCTYAVADAACLQRFVRHLDLEGGFGRMDLITPPDRGAIAPRAACLPRVPAEAAVVETVAWEAVVDWLSSGGRLSGRTVAELARLACVATPQFAVVIGELAAKVATEMIWEQCGPMRDSGGAPNLLRPLQEAARTSSRAADALIAALAATATLRRARSRRR